MRASQQLKKLEQAGKIKPFKPAFARVTVAGRR
jgi:hypothetical protein